MKTGKALLIVLVVLVILGFLLPSLFKVLFNIGVVVIIAGAIVGGMYLQKAINSKERLERKNENNA